VSRPPRFPPLPAKEADLAPAVRAHLEPRGYTVWVNPDGRDYFDVVALRESEVGLIELKRTDWKHVVAQAARRRAWADWLAVVLPRRSLATRALGARAGPIAPRIGVWLAEGGRIEELRPARALRLAADADPFADDRAELRAMLASLTDGTVPVGVLWSLLGRASVRAGRRGATREWRLEEFPDPATGPR
jgi:hypothetical protein